MDVQKNNKVSQEKEINPSSGGLVLIINLIVNILAILAFIFIIIKGANNQMSVGLTVFLSILTGLIGFIVCPIIYGGLKIIQPGEAAVLTLFGKYQGTIKKDGFYFVNPFCSTINPAYNPVAAWGNMVQNQNQSQGIQKTGSGMVDNKANTKKLSLKTRTLINDKQKINDESGTPIEISVNVVWKIRDTAKAVFDVDNYAEYLSVQADSALRNIVRMYPYDCSEEDNEKSLRGSSIEIAEKICNDLQERVNIAGIEVLEARIVHLAYAQEIASAMLQRQQAAAIIAARQKIVEGAVGMVDMALKQLNENNICTLDEERKAQMVSNLLVVLCANKEAQPIVNSGSLY